MKYLVFFLLVFILEAAPSTRQSILNKLNNTVIESISLDDLTIEEIIKILHDKSGNKINFLYLKKYKARVPNAPLTNNIPQMLDPVTGMPIFLPPAPQVFQEPELPRIKTARVSLKNVTLKQLLDISTLCLDQPISYVVTDAAVIFIHRNKGEKPLISRKFRIKPNIFNNGNSNANK
jgi:hypothetical protein